jgi:hypothetical protein
VEEKLFLMASERDKQFAAEVLVFVVEIQSIFTALMAKIFMRVNGCHSPIFRLTARHCRATA